MVKNATVLMFLVTLGSTALAEKKHSDHRCRHATPGLKCDEFTRQDKKSLKRLCKDSSVSQVCGNKKCDDSKKNDRNCPGDCRGGEDFCPSRVKMGSYNARTWCSQVQDVRHPTTVAEAASFVREATSKNMRVRGVGASHSDNELICTDGMVLTMNHLKRIIGLETFEGNEVVHAEGGVTIRELGTWLHERHKALGYAIVGYEAVQLAGVLGTGAHGSSPKHSSILSDRVAYLRMVMHDGRIEEFSEGTTGKSDPQLWRSLQVHLGAFGFITDVKLKVQDDFQIFLTTKSYADDALYDDAQGMSSYIQDCDVASVNWFPQRKRAGVLGSLDGQVIVHCGKAIAKGEAESWENFGEKIDQGAQYVLHAPDVAKLPYMIATNILHRSACNQRWACHLERLRRHQ